MRHVVAGCWVMMVMLWLSACASVLQVDTFNKQYAAGMTAVQAVYTVTAAGVESGRISKEEGRVLLGRADGVREVFGAARISFRINPEEGVAGLKLALAALEALQTDLKRGTQP